jgi:hypothetical protein
MRLPPYWPGKVVAAVGLFWAATAGLATEASIEMKPESGPAQFAAAEIGAAVHGRGEAVKGLRVVLEDVGATLQNEGFAITVAREGTGRVFTVRGGGPGGVMYGGLELAEQIRLGGLEAVQPMERKPHIAMRGAKFNLPLDVRTPSYTDMGDSAQANIATMWDFEFWREYLDHLARDRYNFVSLWNLHPFPSLVKVPEYPDIALDDVQRSTIKFDENYSTRTEDIVTPAMLAQVETVKRITIDGKIEFWRRVMQHAKDRNIDFYLFTWNIYTYGTGGKHGITEALDNATTRDYFKKSVAQLFRTYPLLRGIGVTAGENIGNASSSFQAKEDWLFATYGQGVLDVAREQPGRPIRFIHRQHETRAADIARTFAPLTQNPDIDFVFSFKYAQAHALSSTTQTFHHEFVQTLGDLKTLWTLRNDDALMFRWGSPDFVREFITNMPRDVTQGVYYGSDMWVWGREFLSLDPTAPRQLEVDKHWLDWLLWGRLSYDPTLANDRIVELIGARFPGVPAQNVFNAWQHASMIYPLTTGFHWGQYDFQWYIEACKSRPQPAQTASGFHDVNRFITLGVHPGTDNISIPKFVEAVVNGKEANLKGTTPLQVAEKLHIHATSALFLMEDIAAKSSRELEQTLGDIRAMALLGKYYACKIRGATELALFRKAGIESHQLAAINQLTEAAKYWNDYTAQAASLYKNPLWTNRVGTVDWNALTRDVARDVEIARAPRVQ